MNHSTILIIARVINTASSKRSNAGTKVLQLAVLSQRIMTRRQRNYCYWKKDKRWKDAILQRK